MRKSSGTDRTPDYAPCALCGFWLPAARFRPDPSRPLPAQPACPNCGIVDPTNRFFWQVAGYRTPASAGATAMGAAGLGLLVALAAGTLLALSGGRGASSALLPWAAGALAAALLYWLGIENNRRSRFRRRDSFRELEAALKEVLQPPRALRETGAQLSRRIQDLRRRGEETAALEKALQAVREALAAAAEQGDRARLLLARIAMLRWQNRIEPLLLDHPPAADPLAWQERLRRLGEIRSEGELLAAQLSGPASPPEEARLAETWSVLLRACDRLESELLARQAVAAVEEVQPLAGGAAAGVASVSLEAEQALRHALITHDFGELEAAVAELRAQQARLDLEREIVRRTAALVRRPA